MTAYQIKQLKEKIQKAESLTHVVKYLVEYISIGKILLTTASRRTKNGSRAKKNKYVKGIKDERFFSLDEMTRTFSVALGIYQEHLECLVNEDPHEKMLDKAAMIDAINSFYNAAKSHNINNRFRFLRKQVFFSKNNDELSPINLENLEITDDQLINIKELFTIRKEAFDELSDLTAFYLSILDYNNYKKASIRLTDLGQKAVVEFFMALEVSKNFIDIKKSDFTILKREFITLFGIASRNFTILERRAKDRKKDSGKHLALLWEELHNTYAPPKENPEH